jgi:hypothetical protein
VPEGIDWEVWRVVSSTRFSVSLEEVETRWSMLDLWDANRVLDMFDELERPRGRGR